jgi:hypothetical protein
MICEKSHKLLGFFNAKIYLLILKNMKTVAMKDITNLAQNRGFVYP